MLLPSSGNSSKNSRTRRSTGRPCPAPCRTRCPGFDAARLHAARGEYAEADAELAHAASLVPKPGSEFRLAEARLALGQVYWHAARLKDAHQFWQAALVDFHKVATENPKDQALQEKIASCERQICHRYGALGLWDLAAAYLIHSAEVKRVTSYVNEAPLASLLAAIGQQDVWRDHCQRVMRQLVEKPLDKQAGWHIVRTSCLFDPPAVDLEQCMRLAGESIAANPVGARRWYWPEVALALAQYRATRYADALKTLEGDPVDSPRQSDLAYGGRLCTGYVYALAAHGDGSMRELAPSAAGT